MKVQNWNGYEIRFIEKNGEWWAVLKDICDALNLKTFKVSQRLDPDMMLRVPVETTVYYDCDIPSRGVTLDHDDCDIPSRNIMVRKPRSQKGARNEIKWMLAVNEEGVYEALFASRKLEARKFRRWAGGVLRKLRKNIGLMGYEVMRMADDDVQKEIDYLIDSIYFDTEKDCWMRSVTVQGGDVDQIPLD